MLQAEISIINTFETLDFVMSDFVILDQPLPDVYLLRYPYFTDDRVTFPSFSIVNLFIAKFVIYTSRIVFNSI